MTTFESYLFGLWIILWLGDGLFNLAVGDFKSWLLFNFISDSDRFDDFDYFSCSYSNVCLDVEFGGWIAPHKDSASFSIQNITWSISITVNTCSIRYNNNYTPRTFNRANFKPVIFELLDQFPLFLVPHVHDFNSSDKSMISGVVAHVFQTELVLNKGGHHWILVLWKGVDQIQNRVWVVDKAEEGMVIESKLKITDSEECFELK